MRYSRQILLNLITEQGQKKLSKSKVVIVGLGAIGTVAAELLTRAGVGSLLIIDRDFVELSNLQRQFLFTEKDIGMPKAIVAKNSLKKINKNIRITSLVTDLDYKNVRYFENADIILDCTDNFETRFLINDYCKKKRTPWIYAAVIKSIGTIYSIQPQGPCFSCIFTNHASFETCDTVGVLNTAVTATASIQVTEAIKILLGKETEKDMIRLNVWQPSLLKLKVKKNSKCESCRGNYDYLTGKKGSEVIKLCGTNTYQVKGKKVNLKFLSKTLHAKNFGYCLHTNNITLFKDGRAIVKAKSKEKAKSIYTKFVG